MNNDAVSDKVVVRGAHGQVIRRHFPGRFNTANGYRVSAQGVFLFMAARAEDLDVVWIASKLRGQFDRLNMVAVQLSVL
jgi:hypothetical protein